MSKKTSYTIIKYNKENLLKYQSLSSEVKNIFGEHALRIEHIGSSAVKGMYGKPIIDILLIVKELNIAPDLINLMNQKGYIYEGQYLEESSRLFRKLAGEVIVANIQVFQETSDSIIEILQIRDYLRLHPVEAREYSKLKLELYTKFKEDYKSYRIFKDQYMDSLKVRAAKYFRLLH